MNAKTQEIGNCSELTPMKKLAFAVILQSISDCRAIYICKGLDALRESEPYRAIVEPYGIKFWCHVADIDYNYMSERIKIRTATEHHAENLFSDLKGKGYKHDIQKLLKQ